MPNMPVVRIQKRRLADQVASIVRKKIILGSIREGEYLNEEKLAKELGISRGPIREALNLIENEGLVTGLSNGRTAVVGFSEKDVEEFHIVRLYYETEAIKRIICNNECEETYDKWIMGLHEIINTMKGSLEVKSFNNYIDECDHIFHERIMQKGGNNIFYRMWKCIDGIRATLMEINSEQLTDENIISCDGLFSLHQNIFEGLRDKDLDKTMGALQQHMDSGIRINKMIIRLIGERKDLQV